MRCYLEYKNGSANFARRHAAAKAATADELPETITVRFIGSDGQQTAIGTLDTRTGDITLDGWYDMNGRKLNGKPATNGIYVNNGKKVIIK